MVLEEVAVDALVELPADRDVVDLRGGGSDGLVNANDEPKRGVLVEERLLRLVVRGFATLANANSNAETKNLVRIVRVKRNSTAAVVARMADRAWSREVE